MIPALILLLLLLAMCAHYLKAIFPEVLCSQPFMHSTIYSACKHESELVPALNFNAKDAEYNSNSNTEPAIFWPRPLVSGYVFGFSSWEDP